MSVTALNTIWELITFIDAFKNVCCGAETNRKPHLLHH